MLIWEFSNIIIYVKIVGKIQDQHLSAWLFSNPGDKVQILVESTGLICPVVLHLFWTLSPGLENNHAFKYWSCIFPTILTYIIRLENYQNNISVYGCSPIQGTKFYSCWNLMKPGYQSGTCTNSCSSISELGGCTYWLLVNAKQWFFQLLHLSFQIDSLAKRRATFCCFT